MDLFQLGRLNFMISNKEPKNSRLYSAVAYNLWLHCHIGPNQLSHTLAPTYFFHLADLYTKNVTVVGGPDRSQTQPRKLAGGCSVFASVLDGNVLPAL